MGVCRMPVDFEPLYQELRNRRAETSANRKMLPKIRDQARESGFYTARVSVQATGMPVAVNVKASESIIFTLQ